MATGSSNDSNQREPSFPFADAADNLPELHRIMGTNAFNWDSPPMQLLDGI